ncbi:NAD(P)/FAD-dependent oxidoreductase [Lentzea sp. E54]|uniref:NAD(P)/FAD-dependent oxidoreductase n=1 Tax=Lentzea xerophila TaxID=3435883 RepID=UPI003DA5D69A
MRDGDVIVAGAGMAGLLTALDLARRGARVVLVEPSRAGSGQSGQSHGYLHRGYAYGPDEPLLPTLLGRAHDHWKELLARIPPVTDSSTIAFSDPAAVRRAERYWRNSGLRVRPRTAPAWLAGTPACFRSSEPTYDVGDVLRGLAAQAAAAGVETRPGAVGRIEEDGAGVRATVVGRDGGTAVVRAESAVLAAGAGTPALLARSGLPAVVQLRRAFMLVLRGHLPAVSVLFPEREKHGLFLASRLGDDGRATWLVSDFQSFDSGGAPGHLAGWWARRVLLTLSRVIDAATLARVHSVSGYPATKSGLTPSSGTVAHEFGVELLGGRAVVAGPAKLTLAPLAALRAVQTVAARLGMCRDHDDWEPIAPVPRNRSPVRETWEDPAAALDRPDLLGELPGIDALNALYQR